MVSGVGFMATLELPLPEITIENFDHSWTRLLLVANAKEWDGARQLVIIPTLLRGKLIDYYSELTDDEKNDVDVLKKSLMEKAGLTKDPLAAARDFQMRVQGPAEKARDFAVAIKKKFKEAYLDEAMTSTVLLQKFMTGLRSSTGCQLLLKGKPASLDDAIKQAVEIEYALEFSDDGSLGVRQQDILTVQDSSNSDREELERLTKLIESLSRKVENIEEKLGQPHRNTETRTCYQCGMVGHLKRQCSLNSHGPARKVTGGWPRK